MAKQQKASSTTTVTNTFEGGMSSDKDLRLRDDNTFELSVNGRLVYNEEGTLCWENAKGNSQSVANYNSNLRTLGKAEFPDFTILFSKKIVGQKEIDEIGIVIYNPANPIPNYEVLHSDDNDALGEKMTFNLDYAIQAEGFYESDEYIRVYFTDDFNEPRVFTFKKTGDYSYVRLTESEFTMNIVPDWDMGELTFQGLISGALRTGQYQYAYRLRTKDGYQTPWNPISFHVPVTGKVPGTNNSKYGFENADTVGATGCLINIKYIDTRYDEIDVAYVHSIIASGVKEAGVFVSQKIKASSNFKKEMFFKHVSIENITPINIAEFTDLKDVILKAKTLQIHDNRLWFGNTETKSTFTIPDAVLDNYYVEPEFRGMLIDKYSAKHFYANDSKGHMPTHVPPTGTQSFIKRRHQKWDSTGNDYISQELKSKENSSFGSINDYENYQGAQVCHSFTGYFRGETYRFAAVFFDKKGYPFFAKHFADVRLPSGTNGFSNGEYRTNQLVARRVKDDGTVAFKSVEVGLMGGLTTDVNYSFNSQYNIGGSDSDKKMIGKSSETLRNPSLPDIENQYHLQHNAPSNGGLFKSSNILTNDPNSKETGSVGSISEKVINDGSSFKKTFSRILGLRFGGIDLSVEVDGVPLHELVGGVMITRAERKGVDEQIKDQGLLLNAWRKFDKKDGKLKDGYDTKERKKVWPNTSPVFGGMSQSGQQQEFHYRNDGGGEWSGVGAMSGLYTFDGVNHRVGGDVPRANAAITKIRGEAMVNPSWLTTNISEHNAWRSLQSDLATGYIPRHYVSKNLHTWNTRVLNDDTSSTKRWVRSGVTLDLTKVVNAASSTGSNYGYFKDYIFGTECWLAKKNYLSATANIYWDSLSIFDRYRGGNDSGKLKDNKWLRGRLAPTLMLQIKRNYMSAFGQMTGANGTKGQHLTGYIVSVVEENASPYGGLRNEAIQNTRFHTTGHFLVIDDSTINKIKDGGYMLNELEVWGGDCYLDAFSYIRVLPTIEMDENCRPDDKGISAYSNEAGTSRVQRGGEWRDWSHGVTVPLESKYNFKLTFKESAKGVSTWQEVGTSNGVSVFGDDEKTYYRSHATLGLYESSVSDCGERSESFQLNGVLSYFDRVRPYSAKPVDYVEINDYPTRWHWSNLKQPHNQRVDVFREFEEIANQDLDANLGEISGNAKLFDNIYSIQKKAFGRLRVNERAVVSTEGAGDLKLGDGATMDGIELISYEYGTQHRDSVTKSDKNIYFVDAKMKKLMRFGQDGLHPISDTKGIHTFIIDYLSKVENEEHHTNNKGIVSGYDFGNNDVYFSIKNNSYEGLSDYSVKGSRDKPTAIEYSYKDRGYITILYNENIAAFHTLITAYPTIYFRNGNRFFSNNNDGRGNLWEYNTGNRGSFMNKYFYSYLNFSINHDSKSVKKFDNSVWNVNEEGLLGIKRVIFKAEGIVQEYKDLSAEMVNLSGYSANNRVKYREGLLKFPIRERSYLGVKPRLTGKHAKMSFFYDNLKSDKKFSLSNIDTIIRYHHRK
jgi:hypothetical protein